VVASSSAAELALVQVVIVFAEKLLDVSRGLVVLVVVLVVVLLPRTSACAYRWVNEQRSASRFGPWLHASV
jgi:hypothetical protein